MYALRSLTLLLAILPVVFSAPSAHFHAHRAHATVAVARRGTKCARKPGTGNSSSHVVADPNDNDNENNDDNNDNEDASPSSTKKSAAAAPTKVASQPGSSSGGLRALFPIGETTSSWSTSKLVDGSLPLNAKTLNPTSVMSGLPNSFTTGPEGKSCLKVTYNKGSYRYIGKNGGVSMYVKGPSDVDLTSAKEVTFGYSAYFESGFQFNKGGKLFGLYGGNSDSEARSCSGGRRSDACFSLRLMFRDGGKGEGYAYLPPSPSANKKLCNIPKSYCNPTYGTSIATGAWKFPTGKWLAVSQRVRLNDVGKSNGEIEIFVEGRSVIQASGLQLRTSSSGKFRGLMLQSFFGGHSSDWASPKTQSAYFADFAVAITERL